MTLSAAIANASLDAGPDAGEVYSQTQTRQATTHKKLIDHLYEVVCDLFQVRRRRIKKNAVLYPCQVLRAD